MVENNNSDIRPDGWIRFLPASLRPYALLARLDRPVGAVLLFLPAFWGILLAQISPFKTVGLIILFILGSFVMRGAGCVINDIWDRNLDKKVERTKKRPLASGEISLFGAAVFLFLLLLCGAAILYALNDAARICAAFILIPIILYPAAKRITSWPQIVLGFTFGYGALLGFTAATGTVSLAAVMLYFASLFWILGYDTVYAHQDREDDLQAGIKSSALLLGEKTKPFLAAVYSLTILLLLFSGFLAGLHRFFYFFMSLPVILLAFQIVNLDIDNRASCLKLFKFNQYVGFAVALAIILGIPVK